MGKILIVAPHISEGARELKTSLVDSGVRAYYRRKDRAYVSLQMNVGQDMIVNWGCGNHPNIPSVVADTAVTRLNAFTNVATDKLRAFEAMQAADVPVPEFTTDIGRAGLWCISGNRVYCRTALRGHSGEGIVMADRSNPVVAAPLYTKEVVKRHEFRFHVFCGQVIDGVRKGFRADIPEDQRDRTIMNHAAGTTFFRTGQALERAAGNEALLADCVSAVAALGLDFGAVDVMTDNEGRHYILEVNTAPGLEASTLTRYTEALIEKFNNRTITPWNFANATGSNTPSNNTSENTMPRLTVTVNTASLTTLTQHHTYPVADDRRQVDGTVQIRNDRGRLQCYTDRGQFIYTAPIIAQVAEETPVTPAPQPVTAAPTLRVPEAPTSGAAVRTDVETTSPERTIRLSDSTQVNVTGRVRFNASSDYLTTGHSYEVAEIRLGQNTGRTFIGIEVSGNIRRYRSESFTHGNRCAIASADISTLTAAAAPQPPSTLEDSAGNSPVVGGYVRITTRSGGHGFRVGALVTVSSINVDRRELIVREGSNNQRTVNISRVQVLTEEQVTLLQQESREREGTTTLTLGGTTYRIRNIDVPRAQAAIRQFTI